ncbi:hypothetical protein ACOSQ4_029294 [Xanthoceras sorbifolium]
MVEFDASSVVDLVNGSGPNFADIGLVVSDIQKCLIDFPNCKVSFAPRFANYSAHRLAKLALLSRESMFLVDQFPPCVESLVQADSLG